MLCVRVCVLVFVHTLERVQYVMCRLFEESWLMHAIWLIRCERETLRNFVCAKNVEAWTHTNDKKKIVKDNNIQANLDRLKMNRFKLYTFITLRQRAAMF